MANNKSNRFDTPWRERTGILGSTKPLNLESLRHLDQRWDSPQALTLGMPYPSCIAEAVRWGASAVGGFPDLRRLPCRRQGRSVIQFFEQAIKAMVKSVNSQQLSVIRRIVGDLNPPLRTFLENENSVSQYGNTLNRGFPKSIAHL
ncbi:MAG: hypothetical protein ACYTXY_09380 [Nostoc sp.]